MTTGDVTIDGWTAPGYERARAKFEQNFAEGLELGAAFAAYHRGQQVVDLWGGVADRKTGRPWERDTIALFFSTTKGATAICANAAAQAETIDVDAPVSEYWPEFDRAGKADVTVASLLSHTAGLAWVDEPLTLEQALAWEPMIHALERQTPHWPPGTAHGYHAVTYGHLVGEVVRRATGRSIGTYLRDEIAGPLGLDLWIGLPEEHEPRVAPLTGGLVSAGLGAGAGSAPTDIGLGGTDSMLVKALTAGGAFGARGIWNTRAVHAAEVPGAGGIGDARSLARMYAACIGEVDGVRVLDREQMRAAATQRTAGPDIVLLDLDLQWGLGFIVPSSIVRLGRPGGFGHFGLGGSMGWADPDAELAFGYVMNRMETNLAGDKRSYRLAKSCYDAIG